MIMTVLNDGPNIIRQPAQPVNRQDKENNIAHGDKTCSPMKLLQKNYVCLKGQMLTIGLLNIQYLCGWVERIVRT